MRWPYHAGIALIVALSQTGACFAQDATSHDAGKTTPPSEQDLAKAKPLMPLADPGRPPLIVLPPAPPPVGALPGSIPAGQGSGAFRGSAP